VTIPPRLRKLVLTAHVASSVGWFGAVLAFVGLAVVAVTSDHAATVRGSYLVMEPAARLVLVPLAFASLITGVVQSLVTPWGLFRHYWVVFKLGINVFATIVLLAYLETFDALARAAADPDIGLESVRSASPVVHAVAAAVLLGVATTLAVYKPPGLTPWGRRTR
jgi:uncharacterized membrane protein